MTVSAEELAKEVSHIVDLYVTDLGGELDKLTAETSTELKNAIRDDSPKRTGEYRRGWATQTLSKLKGRRSELVFNKKKPQLTHLLENGHKVRGNSGAEVRRYPHIEVNTEKMRTEFIKKLEEIIKNGGKA